MPGINLETFRGDLYQTTNLGATVGLPLRESDDPNDVFYTTSEPINSIGFLQEHLSGKSVYDIDPFVARINDEVRFPRRRLPSDLYRKVMQQLNSRLPPCTNEKRGHEFRHKRIHIDRSTSQKLASKPKDILTSECIHCLEHWTGLRYPLPEDPRYPEGMSLFRYRNVERAAKQTKAPKLLRAVISPFYTL